MLLVLPLPQLEAETKCVKKKLKRNQMLLPLVLAQVESLLLRAQGQAKSLKVKHDAVRVKKKKNRKLA